MGATNKPKTVAIVSGGLDSVVLTYELHAQGHELHLISFNYGQRHKKETQFAAKAAARLNCKWDLIDLSALTPLIGGSSLTSPNVVVPDGHYAEESMRITVVPNRNAIMLSIAYGIAQAEHATAVALAVHGGDHYIYPDCRPDFLGAFEEMEAHAIGEMVPNPIALLAPYSTHDKAYIAKRADELGVPIKETWSCYKGGAVHCGVCGTCTERREAFELAGVDDPTIYADLTRHWGEGRVINATT